MVRTALLAPEQNVEVFVEAICRLAKSPQTRLEFGRHAREHVEANYEAVRQGERLTEIYSRIEKGL